MNDIISVNDVAEMLQITKGHVYKMTMLKQIPYYKPMGGRNGKLYFKRSEIENFVFSHKVESNSDLEKRLYAESMKKGGNV